MFTAAQESAIHRAACQWVASASAGRLTEPGDSTLAGAADRQVAGVFVTLREAGNLRGCYGAYGGSVTLADGLRSAAVGAAIKDPRFPNLQPQEIHGLHLGVSVLFDIQRIAEVGERRSAEVIVGQHGLTIRRGARTGLLLPSVAVDWKLDSVSFLRQVCKKAGLDDDAWLDDEAAIETFRAHWIAADFDSAVAARFEEPER